MPVNQPAETIGAMAETVFFETEPQRTWGEKLVALDILSNESLSLSRKTAFGQLDKLKNKFGRVEAIKVSIRTAAPANGGSYQRGGNFTYANNDTKVPAYYEAKLFAQPFALPTSDIDIRQPAAGNENAVAAVVEEMRDARHQLGIKLETNIFNPAPGANDFASIMQDLAATGTCGRIAQADYASWATPVIPMANKRLGLDRLAEEIQKYRIRKRGSLDLGFCGYSVWNQLLKEAEARFGRMVQVMSVSEAFGNDDEGNLILETKVDCFKVHGCIFVVSEFHDSQLPTSVFLLSMDRYLLCGVDGNDYNVSGPKDVSIEAATDQTRGLIKWAGTPVVTNRTQHLVFNDCLV